MSFYPTISKADVADSILQVFEGPIRAKIDEWTDQSIVEFLEWFKFKGGNTPSVGLYYFNKAGDKIYCTSTELLNAFKTMPR